MFHKFWTKWQLWPKNVLLKYSQSLYHFIFILDIEGSELEVITDLVVSGALQHIDLALVEYHSKSFYKSDFRNSAILGLEKTMDTLNYLSRTLK